MDVCTVAGIVGRRGSGKTTLLKTLAAGQRRVLFWDWRGEYDGTRVGLDDLPDLFHHKRFVAVYRPGAGDLVREFDALCHVVRCLGKDLTFCCDEIALVTPHYREGGMGLLLRYSRPQRINLYWATQRAARIPGVLLSEVNTLYVFHLHGRGDLQALSTVLDPDDLGRVAALPPHQYLTVQL
jgi:hypothetical protein